LAATFVGPPLTFRHGHRSPAIRPQIPHDSGCWRLPPGLPPLVWADLPRRSFQDSGKTGRHLVRSRQAARIAGSQLAPHLPASPSSRPGVASVGAAIPSGYKPCATTPPNCLEPWARRGSRVRDLRSAAFSPAWCPLSWAEAEGAGLCRAPQPRSTFTVSPACPAAGGRPGAQQGELGAGGNAAFLSSGQGRRPSSSGFGAGFPPADPGFPQLAELGFRSVERAPPARAVDAVAVPTAVAPRFCQ